MLLKALLNLQTLPRVLPLYCLVKVKRFIQCHRKCSRLPKQHLPSTLIDIDRILLQVLFCLICVVATHHIRTCTETMTIYSTIRLSFLAIHRFTRLLKLLSLLASHTPTYEDRCAAFKDWLLTVEIRTQVVFYLVCFDLWLYIG